MRRDVTEYVWEHSKLKGNKRLLLLAIAYFANEHGVAWPSVSTLTKLTGMSSRTIQRLIFKLPASEVDVKRSAGPRGTHLFQIRMTRSLPLFPGDSGVDKRVTDCHPDKLSGDKRGRKGVTKRAKTPAKVSPNPFNQLLKGPAVATTRDGSYVLPAAADLKFPLGTTEKAQRAFLGIAGSYRLSREELQLAFDEVNDRLSRRERVDNVVLLVKAIAAQIRAGTFYGTRAERHAKVERGGGRPLSEAELEVDRKLKRVA